MSLHFIYFPYLIHEIRDAAIYNFPQMTKTDFSQTASSDILLQLIEDKKQAANLPPCIMQYDRTEDGIDYVNAFPIIVMSFTPSTKTSAPSKRSQSTCLRRRFSRALMPSPIPYPTPSTRSAPG